MCDSTNGAVSSAVEMLIEDTVQDFVQQGKEFTAFDVTAAVRKQTQEDVYHRDVRGFIHHQMQNHLGSTYQQVSHPVHAAILYQPVNAPTVKVPSPPTSGVVASGWKATPSANDLKGMAAWAKKAGTNVGMKPDARGSITVRADQIRKIGFKPGQKLFAHCFKKHIVLTKDPLKNADHTTTYTVNGSGNVRITKKTLSQANIQPTSGVTAKTFVNSLEIR